jgi:hypothetical protein
MVKHHLQYIGPKKKTGFKFKCRLKNCDNEMTKELYKT